MRENYDTMFAVKRVGNKSGGITSRYYWLVRNHIQKREYLDSKFLSKLLSRKVLFGDENAYVAVTVSSRVRIWLLVKQGSLKRFTK